MLMLGVQLGEARARLAELYAQHEHELTGAAPVLVEPASMQAQPAVMHCR